MQLATTTDDPAPPAGGPPSGLLALIEVARRHGLELAADELMAAHGLDEQELAPATLMGLAQAHGLEGRRLELDWADLAGLNGALPLLLQLRDGRWVVLAEVRPRVTPPLVMLADPADDPGLLLPIDEARLETAWAGTALVLRRQHAALSDARPFGLGWIMGRVAEDAGTFRDIGLAVAVTSVFALVPPLLYMMIVDRVLVHQRISTLTTLAVFVGFVLLFDTAFGWLRRRLLAMATARLDGRISLWLFERLLALPLDMFERTPTGVIVHKLNEIRRIRNFLTGQMFSTAMDGATLFVLVPVMFALDAGLAWFVLGIAALMCLTVLLFVPAMNSAYGRVMVAEHRRNSLLVETVHGMRTVKALAIEGVKRRQWDERTAEWVHATTRLQLLANLPQTILAPLEKGIYAGALLIGGWFVIEQQSSLQAGTLVAFTMIASRVVQPFVQIAGMLHQLQEVRGALTQVASIVDLPPERARSGVRPSLKGQIELIELRFRYAGSATPALDGLDHAIEAGSMVGIVGRSGSGKTTLTRLLQGFHQDYEGLVRIDGVELREIDLGHLRRHLGVVLQDSFLFNGTIRDNILAGRSFIAPARVIEAARLAGAEEFIERLPRGYDTGIEEGGSNLSGGQRQRLAIARALVSDPPILILDEATSALDPESEAIVNAHLRRIAKARTVLVVSHRLTSLVRCDSILVLERGRLLANGRHEHLLATCEPYRRLWLQQHLSGGQELGHPRSVAAG